MEGRIITTSQCKESDSSLRDVRCVIFDKDGTIVCFHSMWTPWAMKVASEISLAVGLQLEEQILTCLGVDLSTLRTKPGLLAEGTKLQIAEALVELVVSHGVDLDVASRAVKDLTLGCDIDKEHLKFVTDLVGLFTLLQKAGIRVGVCTSDDRTETVEALKRGNVFHLVDAIACGDDPDGKPKPDASNALRICGELGISPQSTIMIGDTKTDIELGHNAKLLASVGVLTGIGTEEVLKLARATHIIQSVDEVPHLLSLSE